MADVSILRTELELCYRTIEAKLEIVAHSHEDTYIQNNTIYPDSKMFAAPPAFTGLSVLRHVRQLVCFFIKVYSFRRIVIGL